MDTGEERMIIPDQAFYGVGAGALGLATGYAMKKVVKIALVIVGLFIAALAYLESQRIITVNWTNTTTVADNTLLTVYHQVQAIAGHAAQHIDVVLGVGFGAGFLLGFMKG